MLVIRKKKRQSTAAAQQWDETYSSQMDVLPKNIAMPAGLSPTPAADLEMELAGRVRHETRLLNNRLVELVAQNKKSSQAVSNWWQLINKQPTEPLKDRTTDDSKDLWGKRVHEVSATAAKRVHAAITGRPYRCSNSTPPAATHSFRQMAVVPAAGTRSLCWQSTNSLLFLCM